VEWLTNHCRPDSKPWTRYRVPIRLVTHLIISTALSCRAVFRSQIAPSVRALWRSRSNQRPPMRHPPAVGVDDLRSCLVDKTA
jgi:hypothetical protein